MSAKVSVIIPVYNTEKTVGRAIDSVLSQTYKDIEIICVDDGSPDNAISVLKEYEATIHSSTSTSNFNSFKLIRQANKGLSGARNTGLDAATGEYVAFLDSDDTLPPYALEVMVAAAEQHNVDLVVSPGKRNYVSTTPLKTLIENRKMRSSAWNKLYRRSTIGDQRFIEGIYFEDWPFVTQFAARIDRMAVVEAPCYIYTEDNVSITRSAFSEKKVRSYERGIRETAAHLRATPAWPLAQKRCAMAAAMMINKVHKSHDPALKSLGRQIAHALHSEGILRYRDLPLKSLLRMYLIK